jgi:hypothetical protein
MPLIRLASYDARHLLPASREKVQCDGVHERVVVNVERFDKRVQRKINGE